MSYKAVPYTEKDLSKTKNFTRGGMNRIYQAKSNFWLRAELKRLQLGSDPFTGEIILIKNALRKRGELPSGRLPVLDVVDYASYCPYCNATMTLGAIHHGKKTWECVPCGFWSTGRVAKKSFVEEAPND